MQKTDLCADLMVHVYLSEFIKKYLQKFQERFKNLTFEENKMRRNTVTYWTTADFANCETFLYKA